MTSRRCARRFFRRCRACWSASSPASRARSRPRPGPRARSSTAPCAGSWRAYARGGRSARRAPALLGRIAWNPAPQACCARAPAPATPAREERVAARVGCSKPLLQSQPTPGAPPCRPRRCWTGCCSTASARASAAACASSSAAARRCPPAWPSTWPPRCAAPCSRRVGAPRPRPGSAHKRAGRLVLAPAGRPAVSSNFGSSGRSDRRCSRSNRASPARAWSAWPLCLGLPLPLIARCPALHLHVRRSSGFMP
jgi:hypothetical protein